MPDSRLDTPRPLLRLLPAVLLLLLAACAPQVAGMGPAITTPAIEQGALRTADGLRLRLHERRPEGPAHAVVLVLHGLNDHAASTLRESMPPLVEGGLHVIAYDQRGHAENPNRGVWAGEEALVADALAAIRLLRARHRDLPFFVLGESLGANVALVAMERLRDAGEAGLVDGWVMVGPGLWTLDEMNPLTAVSFRLALLKFPRLGVSSAAPTMTPSNNWEMLERIQADPLTVRDTRVDVVAGLLELNGRGQQAVARCCTAPTLFLFGAQDRVLEQGPTIATLRTLPPGGGGRVALYPEGWHILLRDLDRSAVMGDILAFTRNPDAPLPSGAEALGARWVATGAP